jgi:hypothetical protein
MRPYGGKPYGGAHRKLDRLVEAKAGRRRKPPDPGDRAAVLWDWAHRIRDFILAQIAEGYEEPYEVSPVEEIYAHLLRLEEERKEVDS